MASEDLPDLQGWVCTTGSNSAPTIQRWCTFSRKTGVFSQARRRHRGDGGGGGSGGGSSEYGAHTATVPLFCVGEEDCAVAFNAAPVSSSKDGGGSGGGGGGGGGTAITEPQAAAAAASAEVVVLRRSANCFGNERLGGGSAEGAIRAANLQLPPGSRDAALWREAPAGAPRLASSSSGGGGGGGGGHAPSGPGGKAGHLQACCRLTMGPDSQTPLREWYKVMIDAQARLAARAAERAAADADAVAAALGNSSSAGRPHGVSERLVRGAASAQAAAALRETLRRARRPPRVPRALAAAGACTVHGVAPRSLKLEHVDVYTTPSRLYLVGYDARRTRFRLLKLDRTVAAPPTLGSILTSFPEVYVRSLARDLLTRAFSFFCVLLTPDSLLNSCLRSHQTKPKPGTTTTTPWRR